MISLRLSWATRDLGIQMFQEGSRYVDQDGSGRVIKCSSSHEVVSSPFCELGDAILTSISDHQYRYHEGHRWIVLLAENFNYILYMGILQDR